MDERQPSLSNFSLEKHSLELEKVAEYFLVITSHHAILLRKKYKFVAPFLFWFALLLQIQNSLVIIKKNVDIGDKNTG